MLRAGIIAAGEGSRFQRAGVKLPKPLIRVGGMSLLERTLRFLDGAGIRQVALIVNEEIPEVVDHARGLGLPLEVLPLVKSTPSSMHSLHELSRLLPGQRFVLCTVDSVLLPAEAAAFIRHFSDHPELDLLLSYTDFIDDEKPLLVDVEPGGRVRALGPEAADSGLCTVGLYGVSPSVLPLLDEQVSRGVQKLRNFLGAVVQSGAMVQGFRLSKAVDVDRPEDLRVAEDFIRRHGLPTAESENAQ